MYSIFKNINIQLNFELSFNFCFVYFYNTFPNNSCINLTKNQNIKYEQLSINVNTNSNSIMHGKT